MRSALPVGVPGIRDHYLIHYIIYGKGYYKLGQQTYELNAGDTFLVYPNTEVTYYAAEEDSWEYAWVGFTGSDASMILKATDFTPEVPFIRNTPLGDAIRRQILSPSTTRAATNLSTPSR